MSENVPARLRFGRHPTLMLVAPLHPRLVPLAKKAVGGGVDLIQVRDKAAAPERLARAAEKLAQATPALLVVNGDLELAMEHDGVHLPEGRDAAAARARLGEERLVGCSVHSVDAALAAAAAGADYLLAGTIFASASHPDQAPAGLELLKAISSVVRVPVVAIGGITPERVKPCLRAGAQGVAVLSPFLAADDPRALAKEYRTALEEQGR